MLTATQARIVAEARDTIAARGGMQPDELRRHLLANVIGLSMYGACELISRAVASGHLELREGRYHAPRITDMRPGFLLPGQSRIPDGPHADSRDASRGGARHRRQLPAARSRGGRPSSSGHLSQQGSR